MRGTNAPIDRMFLFLLGALVALGLAMLLSASGPLGVTRFQNASYYFTHQLLYGVLPGLALFGFFAWLDYRVLRHFAFLALILSVVLLVLVYIPGIGLRFGGAGRWVKFGPLAFQPSEFVKMTFLLYVSAWLAARQEARARTIVEGLVPFLGMLIVVGSLLIMQPNTGSVSVIVGSALAIYFVGGAPLGWFGVLVGLGVSGVALLIKMTPYRAARFMTFLHPELDPQGQGYHINQAFLAIGSGGLFGLGFGHSRQKFQYLPEVAGDSIFAVMSEEFGFFLMIGFLTILAALVHRCFAIARNAPDMFGRFLAVGIGSWIAIQSFFNMASMLGLMPMTGVTLPFISYGSSAFIALAIAMGILASISRHSRRVL